jgi:(p)ppGpp synthase/HD superfamily hydrolase
MQYTDILPYLPYSLHLAAKPRRGGGNMFRHQMETLAILMEYGYTEPVLLKASLIHDLLEDGHKVDFRTHQEIAAIDGDGPAVLELVKEVSIREVDGVEEPKAEFLHRIMTSGTEWAKVLKLADRISNINALPLTRDNEFTGRYIVETQKCILPFSEAINSRMAEELKNTIENILKYRI